RRRQGEARRVDRRVRQGDGCQQVAMPGGPAQRDDAAPVVAEGDHGTAETERVGEVAEVGDAVREAPEGGGALREAHVELVDRDHTPRSGGFGGGLDDAAPEVGPGGVAVDGEDGAGGGGAKGFQDRSVVQHVPAVRGARAVATSGGGDGEVSGEFGADPGPAPTYHASSSIAVFSPDPTPMHSTRSPGLSELASWARVIGSEAGPTLPHFGKVIGTRS